MVWADLATAILKIHPTRAIFDRKIKLKRQILSEQFMALNFITNLTFDEWLIVSVKTGVTEQKFARYHNTYNAASTAAQVASGLSSGMMIVTWSPTLIRK